MNKILGLDLNSHAIKFAYLHEHGKKWHIVKCGRSKIEQTETNTSGIVKGLRESLKDMDFLGMRIVSIVSHPHLLVREFILPQMPHRELLEATKWKIKDYLNFPLEEAVIDVKVIEKFSEETTKKLRVLAVAIPQETVIRNINILKAAGIMPSIITIAPIALENLIAHLRALKDELIATINTGLQITEISIFKHRKLEFTRVISSGLERLPLEIRRSFDYYLEESHGGKVQKVILFRGETEAQELFDILRQKLALPVEVINPLKETNISCESTCMRSKERPVLCEQISVSLGAALSYDRGVNLLPGEAKRQIKDYLLSAGARLLAILGSFVFLFIYISSQFNIIEYRERIMAARAEAETLIPLIKNIEPVENLSREIAIRLDLVNSLLARSKVWSEVMRQISRILPESITISNLRVGEEEIMMKGVVLAKGRESPETILSSFIASLEKEIFKNVSLVSAQWFEEKGLLEFNLSSKLDF